MRTPPILGRRRRGQAAAPLPDPIAQNIDAVVEMHAVAERQVDTHQRAVEGLTAWLGRPQFFYGVLIGVSLWMLVNGLAPRVGLPRWDAPPFDWLQGLLGLTGLLTTTVVLITQNRQGRLAERREQLDMQMSLLVEQRRDLPDVRDRVDAEAEALTQSVDPHAVLATLERRLEETQETAAGAQIVTEEMDAAAAGAQQAVQEAKGEVR